MLGYTQPSAVLTQPTFRIIFRLRACSSMKTADIRRLFLNYFKERGHHIVSSSPLIPGNDPTLLFTNAGMVQFKDVFLGQEKRSYTRAASVQRCVRAGGKHNDLDNVGYTARHHTFFEMLGNFSFGDYFKREAIHYAWEFLTQILNIPAEKLWITVYKDDDEAANIWFNEIKIDPARFSRCDKDNFWEMGETGPCGPCSEIFYDHGPEIPGGPPGSPDADADRYIEIWNLVFMQYQRQSDGQLIPIPKPCVDTGSGLERLAAVVQGVHTNYDIDLFQNLLHATAKIIDCRDLHHVSLRVIADHIRSCAFLITDSVIPSNEGRGYVLRRIIRRAIRHGHQLGASEPFFYKLVAPLVKEMGEAYPELVRAQAHIERVLLQEEENFNRTLEQGLKILEQGISDLKGKQIPGDLVFRLYDTYGFPPDLTADIARERGLHIDHEGFEAKMAQQRQQSKSASKFGVDYTQQLAIKAQTQFKGYEVLEHEARITHLFREGQPVVELREGEKGWVVLDSSPFYAESGGQVGDQGELHQDDNHFNVADTRKEGIAHVHEGSVQKGHFIVGQKVLASVNISKRRATMRNHSATHLLHAALRERFGESVMQKGSWVGPTRLRFDFTHPRGLTFKECWAIEQVVNAKIRENLAVHTELMSPDSAKKAGAMALFGEKYGEEVRVLSMGAFSKELCGGTHVERTGDIGFFKIISETSVASGIRRIEAVTGDVAIDTVQKMDDQRNILTQLLKTSPEDIINKVDGALTKIKDLEKQLGKLKVGFSADSYVQLLAKTQCTANGINVLAEPLDAVDLKGLREMLDRLQDRLDPSVIVLATLEGEKITFVVSVSPELNPKIRADELARDIASKIDGKAGGRADRAQGGGSNIDALPLALKDVFKWVVARE